MDFIKRMISDRESILQRLNEALTAITDNNSLERELDALKDE